MKSPSARANSRVAPLLVACALVCALAAAAAPAPSKEHKVSIEGVKYTPKELKIKKGDTVVWTNADDRDHTVTADDDSFKSKKIASGDTYERKFAKAGKYKYHCDYHPRMKAVVVVEE
jgi:plastocyanin